MQSGRKTETYNSPGISEDWVSVCYDLEAIQIPGVRDLWGKMGGKMDEQALLKENAEKFDTCEKEIFQVLMQSLLFFCNIGFPFGSEQNRTCDMRLMN